MLFILIKHRQTDLNFVYLNSNISRNKVEGMARTVLIKFNFLIKNKSHNTLKVKKNLKRSTSIKNPLTNY